MRFEDYSESLEGLPLPAADQADGPDLETLIEVRSLVSQALGDREFLADCIERELHLIQRISRVRSGLVPFCSLPRTGISVAFGYWRPGGSVAPHEHTAWTVTGVWHNQLQVLTFDRDESYRRGQLVPKSCFEAPVGKVGYIHRPCIHQPRNVSEQWSMSLHLISPQDGRYRDGVPPLLSGMAGRDGISSTEIASHGIHPAVMLMRQKMAHTQQLAMALLGMKSQRAREVLGSLYEVGSSKTRRLIEAELPDAVPPGDCLEKWTLRKVDDSLVLSCNRTDDGICLVADSASGPQEVLKVNEIGYEALAYIVRNPTFSLDDLPGNMRNEDHAMLAMALENSGVFQRMKH